MLDKIPNHDLPGGRIPGAHHRLVFGHVRDFSELIPDAPLEGKQIGQGFRYCLRPRRR